MDLSDEEKHALELRRERSNKISKLMGEYLLKGYKMLGSTCNKCGTILMRDRQQNDYCVSCHDIDGLTSSMEIEVSRTTNDDIENPVSHTRTQVNRTDNAERTTRDLIPNLLVNTTDEYRGILKDVQNSILLKMKWAGDQLQNCALEDSFKLLELIKVCQETIKQLQTP